MKNMHLTSPKSTVSNVNDPGKIISSGKAPASTTDGKDTGPNATNVITPGVPKEPLSPSANANCRNK